MTPTPQAASAQTAPAARPLLVPRRFVRPPRFWLLPQPRKRARGMAASTVLHCLTIAALTFLPALFPAPVVMNPVKPSELAEPVVLQPLVAPHLPEIEDRGSGSPQPVFHPTAPTPGASGPPEAPPAQARGGASPSAAAPEPPPETPDFSAPQRIVSLVPNPVNRVQTIQRPDLVAPPKLKFPLRLQAQVSLPAAVVPVLEMPPPETPQPAPTPVAPATEEIPVAKPTVEKPVVTLSPKRASAIRPEKAPSKTVAPNLRIAADAKSDSLKALVVVNAVQVVAEATPVPDAELAGSFAVGPSPGAATTEKSAAGGAGKSAANPANAGSNASEGTPAGSAEGAPGSGARSGPPAAVAGHGAGPGTSSAPSSPAGNGSGVNGVHIIGTAGPGGGTGTGSSGGASGRGSGNGSPTGISISGGVPGRSSGSVTGAPMQRSYGMMIISGGNNGGASRDLGVFGRSETVYSVTIPVAGGADWPMQYALSNPAQASAGLLAPPFVEKKVAATIPRSRMLGDSGPVFVTGTIDENGKTQSLRCLRSQDARCQPALRALGQWEFLPAQLDGKPVAVKVLVGVTVSTVE